MNKDEKTAIWVTKGLRREVNIYKAKNSLTQEEVVKQGLEALKNIDEEDTE